MNRIIRLFPAVFGCFLLFSGCAGSGDTRNKPVNSPTRTTAQRELVAFMSRTNPVNGQPVFLGVGMRRRDREEESHMALLHVADQVSRFIQISGQYQISFDSSGRTTIVKENILTDWKPEQGQSLLETFETLETFQDQDGTYLLVIVPPLQHIGPEVTVETSGSRPVWVDTPPVIPGYYVSVGLTQRRRTVKDSVDFADEDALKGIIMTVLSEVDSDYWDKTVDNRGTIEGGSSLIRGSGSLKEFYVLARWISTDDQYYYSLAVAPASK